MSIGNRLGNVLACATAALIAILNVHGFVSAAEPVTSVPLGGSTRGNTGDRYFGVYLPTRSGGTLHVKTTSGEIQDLKASNGQALTNGRDVGMDHNGWAVFKVAKAKEAYTVSTTFVQTGESRKKPWNYYYWPTKADSIHEPWAGGNGRVDTGWDRLRGDDQLLVAPGSYVAPGTDIVSAGPNGLLETLPAPGDDATWFPNLYDDLNWMGPDSEHEGKPTVFQTPSPLLKYDQLFGTTARQWEAAFSQSSGVSRWPGHCLGGAVAAIQMNEPTPAPGSGLTRDELKALWAELGENHLNHQIGDYANDIPAGPPRPGPDATDFKAPRVHAMLEDHIRGQRQALLANLRAFPPRGTENEVWNHGVYKYVATYHALAGRGPRAVRIEVELHANTGSMLNGQDDHDRVVQYVYDLVYGLDGRIDETNPYAADWISVGGEAMFAPLNLLEVTASRWAGHNPYVTEANVRSLDLANGGAASGRLAGSPPLFQSAARYEAGRPAMIASAPVAGGFESTNSTAPAYNNPYNNNNGGGGVFRFLFGGR